MGVVGLLTAFIGIINLTLGVLVLNSNSAKDLNRAYFFCTFTMALWSFFLYLYGKPLFLTSEFWLKMVYLASYLMAISQLLFVVKFNSISDTKKFFRIILLLSPLLIYGFYLLIIKDSVILSVGLEDGIVVASMGKDYIMYSLPIFLMLFLMFYMHIVEIKNYVGVKRRQAIHYVLAGIFMIVPLLIFDFVLPISFNNTFFYHYSTIGNIFWAGIIAYSIYNARFLDVRIVVGNVLIFLFRSFYLFLFALGIAYLMNSGLFGAGNMESFLLTIIYCLTAAVLFNFLDKKFEKFVIEKFVYAKYNPIDELQRFTRLNAEELELSKILGIMSSIVESTVKPEFFSILIFDRKELNLIAQESKCMNESALAEIKNLLQDWENLNSNPILILSEMSIHESSGKEAIDVRKHRIKDFMERHKIETIIPFSIESDVDGILILSQKGDRSLYNSGDIDFLEGIVKNAGVSVERSLLYSELKSFNINLQEQISKQTGELQVKISELEEARRKERDMIDIMGHELRTPIAIAKLNVQLMKKYTDTNPPEYKKYLDRLVNSVENEIRLINALLTSAKLEGERVELHRERVSTSEVIEDVIHAYQYDAKSRGIKLIQDVDEDTPDVFADRVRVQEVLDNLLNNAVKYTKEGSVILQTTYTKDHVQINIIDSGIGIPKEELASLGTKFHRVGNYIRKDSGPEIVRPGGTGLGLFVVFSLVEQMGGKIWVKSQEGKGTTFSFTLPVYSGQKADVIDSKTKDQYKKLGFKKS